MVGIIHAAAITTSKPSALKTTEKPILSADNPRPNMFNHLLHY